MVVADRRVNRNIALTEPKAANDGALRNDLRPAHSVKFELFDNGLVPRGRLDIECAVGSGARHIGGGSTTAQVRYHKSRQVRRQDRLCR